MEDQSTRTVAERFRHAGYSQEEEYFYRRNQEAIRSIRAGAERARPKAQSTTSDSQAGQLVGAAIDPAASNSVNALRHLISSAIKPLPTGIGQFPV